MRASPHLHLHGPKSKPLGSLTSTIDPSIMSETFRPVAMSFDRTCEAYEAMVVVALATLMEQERDKGPSGSMFEKAFDDNAYQHYHSKNY